MKTKITFIIFILAALLAPTRLHSEDSAVFAPYPGNLRVGTKENEVVLSWTDSSDITAGYAVYRHKFMPDINNFSEAEFLGYADVGVSGFSYNTQDKGAYYYFVLGRIPEKNDKDKQAVYKLFIPLRNMTINTVSIKTIEVKSAQTGISATITGITAWVDGEAIVISVDAKGDTGRLVVYRSTKPVLNAGSLLEAVLTAIIEPNSGEYKDYPVPGIDYYYAVLAEKDLSSGSIKFVADQNTTTRAISIAAGVYRIGLPSSSITSRSMPLPYLMLSKSFIDARPVDAYPGDISEPIFKDSVLSAETEKSIQNLLAGHGSSTKAEKPKITIFPEDLKAGSGGEEYILASIVSEYFVKGLYSEVTKQITLFLSLPRSKNSVDKAHFYRAQSEALSGLYREAFFDFLQSQNSYYIESSLWIEYILDQLRQNKP